MSLKPRKVEQITVEEFFKKFKTEWYKFPKANSMEELWNTTADSGSLIWLASRRGVTNDQERQLYNCACIRTIWDLLKDDRSKAFVETMEAFHYGKTNKTRLTAAKKAAHEAAYGKYDVICREYKCVEEPVYGGEAERLVCRITLINGSNDLLYMTRCVTEERAENDSDDENEQKVIEDRTRDSLAQWLRDNIIPNFNRESFIWK